MTYFKMCIRDRHIIVHAEQSVFEVGAGEAVLRDCADAAILHVTAKMCIRDSYNSIFTKRSFAKKLHKTN